MTPFLFSSIGAQLVYPKKLGHWWRHLVIFGPCPELSHRFLWPGPDCPNHFAVFREFSTFISYIHYWICSWLSFLHWIHLMSRLTTQWKFQNHTDLVFYSTQQFAVRLITEISLIPNIHLNTENQLVKE